MSRVTPTAEMVSARRLCETAVTPSDCSMENATTRRYDGSLPISVMSVPCSVVTVRGVRPGETSSMCRARYAAVACGTA